MKDVGLSERRSCCLAGLNRSTYQYALKPRYDEPIRTRLKELALKKTRYGAPLLTVLIRKEFGAVNHKRVERIYSEEGLQLPRKRRKGVKYERKQPLEPSTRPNERWSMDFMSDSLYDGRKFRVLTIIDDFTRESVGMEVDTGISGERVNRVLERIAALRGLPETIVMDNGPEFTSKAMLMWSEQRGVRLHHIEPGKPNQNAFIESFNGTFRDGCLNQHWFESIFEARSAIERWRVEYNIERPHSSLGKLTPMEFRRVFEKQEKDATMVENSTLVTA
jgi:putative transposase